MPGNEPTSGPNMCQSTLVNAILRILSAKGARRLRAVLTVSVSDPNRALRGSPARFRVPGSHLACSAPALRPIGEGARVFLPHIDILSQGFSPRCSRDREARAAPLRYLGRFQGWCRAEHPREAPTSAHAWRTATQPPCRRGTL